MQHVDIVFDGPPGPEAGRFIEVEDAAGNSIKLGEWIERAERVPPGYKSRRTPSRWVLRIEDPRELRRQVDGVWDVLDHRVDGQPFWTEREIDLGMAVAQVLRHYRDQVTLIVSQRDRYLAELEKAQLRIRQLENEKAELDRSAQSAAKISTEQITKLCEENERRGRDLETARKEYEAARSARDAVWVELQAMREATMLEPPGGDWAKIDAEHLRQHVQDMGDQITKLTRERDQMSAECLEWSKASHHLDHTIIAPPQLRAAAERVSNELASARVARDEWKAAARTLGSKIEQPAELVAAIDSLRDSMKVAGQLCTDNTALNGKIESQRNEIATLRRHLDTIGAMLIPAVGSQTFTRLPHEIEAAARTAAQHREALVEMAKALGINNAAPGYLISRVTDLRADLDARSKQLDAANVIVARFRKALVVANSPKMDAAAELEEIRAIVMAALKRAEMTPIEPLRSLAAELADAFTSAARDRDKAQKELEEMAQEMARGVHPEDVAQAVESVQTLGLEGARAIMGRLYNREDVRAAIVKDIDAALSAAGILPGNILRRHVVGHGGWAVKAADAACDRFEGLLRLPLEAEAVEAEDDDSDDEITIGLDDACDVLEDVLDDNYGVPISENLVSDILAEFRARWETDPEDLADAAADDEPQEVKISDAQIDTIVDKLAERLAAKGHRVRLIKPR